MTYPLDAYLESNIRWIYQNFVEHSLVVCVFAVVM